MQLGSVKSLEFVISFQGQVKYEKKDLIKLRISRFYVIKSTYPSLFHNMTFEF